MTVKELFLRGCINWLSMAKYLLTIVNQKGTYGKFRMNNLEFSIRGKCFETK